MKSILTLCAVILVAVNVLTSRARIRAFVSFITESFSELAPLIEGKRPQAPRRE